MLDAMLSRRYSFVGDNFDARLTPRFINCKLEHNPLKYQDSK